MHPLQAERAAAGFDPASVVLLGASLPVPNPLQCTPMHQRALLENGAILSVPAGTQLLGISRPDLGGGGEARAARERLGPAALPVRSVVAANNDYDYTRATTMNNNSSNSTRIQHCNRWRIVPYFNKIGLYLTNAHGVTFVSVGVPPASVYIYTSTQLAASPTATSLTASPTASLAHSPSPP